VTAEQISTRPMVGGITVVDRQPHIRVDQYHERLQVFDALSRTTLGEFAAQHLDVP
jgi:hypothetical protein